MQQRSSNLCLVKYSKIAVIILNAEPIIITYINPLHADDECKQQTEHQILLKLKFSLPFLDSA